MTDKPIALIVDDDREWLSMLEDVLGKSHRVVKAKTLSEADSLIANKEMKIRIGLVDIKLDDEIENEESGLSVMFKLNEAGIPCIGVTSNSGNGIVVRDAFVQAQAKDVWFKDEKFVDLNQKIKNIEILADIQKSSEKELVTYVKVLLVIPITIALLLLIISMLWQNNSTLIIRSVFSFTIVTYLFLALFYKRITGKEFTELFSNIFGKKK